MHENTVMTEVRGVEALLSPAERKVYEAVLDSWPASMLEIAVQLGGQLDSRESRRRLSTRYAYYVKKLVEKRLVLSKRAGHSLVVWPLRIERYRVIHDILNER